MAEKGLLSGNGKAMSGHRFFVSGPAKPFADLAQNLIEGTIKVYQVILPW